jgi:REP element-mobilizing transposase RayT
MAGHTFVCLHAHLVFSTKHREPLIDKAWQQRLYDYTGGIARNLRCVLLAAGGMPDHVHYLVGMHQTVAPADLVRTIKANSTTWVHETIGIKNFGWQEGYGAFAVSKSGLQPVKDYINSQEVHHKTMSFKDEFLAFLTKHEVDFDPRYVFE